MLYNVGRWGIKPPQSDVKKAHILTLLVDRWYQTVTKRTQAQKHNQFTFKISICAVLNSQTAGLQLLAQKVHILLL